MHRRRHYIFPDLDTLAAAFVCDINRFLSETGRLGKPVHVALSGGSTPLIVFRQLVNATRREDWDHVHFYWGDERCVPAGDSQSNYGNAFRLFMEPLHIPQENIHQIKGDEDPDKEALRYGRLLKEQLPVEKNWPVFDWIWLGLGDDGHTASIFPGQMELWKAGQPCVVSRHPGTQQPRISITGGVINAARRVAFLVSGRSKSSVVNQIVMKEDRYLEYPAFHVAPGSGNVEWYLDMEATSWM